MEVSAIRPSQGNLDSGTPYPNASESTASLVNAGSYGTSSLSSSKREKTGSPFEGFSWPVSRSWTQEDLYREEIKKLKMQSKQEGFLSDSLLELASTSPLAYEVCFDIIKRNPRKAWIFAEATASTHPVKVVDICRQLLEEGQGFKLTDVFKIALNLDPTQCDKFLNLFVRSLKESDLSNDVKLRNINILESITILNSNKKESTEEETLDARKLLEGFISNSCLPLVLYYVRFLTLRDFSDEQTMKFLQANFPTDQLKSSRSISMLAEFFERIDPERSSTLLFITLVGLVQPNFKRLTCVGENLYLQLNNLRFLAEKIALYSTQQANMLLKGAQDYMKQLTFCCTVSDKRAFNALYEKIFSINSLIMGKKWDETLKELSLIEKQSFESPVSNTVVVGYILESIRDSILYLIRRAPQAFIQRQHANIYALMNEFFKESSSCEKLPLLVALIDKCTKGSPEEEDTSMQMNPIAASNAKQILRFCGVDQIGQAIGVYI